jgi:toxin CptA
MQAGDRISVELHGSRWLRPALAAAHVIAVAALAASLGPGWLLWGGVALIAVSALIVLPRARDVGVDSRLELAADGSCRWLRREGVVSGRLRPDTTALPGLIVLRFDETGRRRPRALVLFPASLGTGDWRRLQVFLRWAVRFDAAASILSAGPTGAGPGSRG